MRDGTIFFISPSEGDNIDAFQEIYIQKRYTKFYIPKGDDVVIDIGAALGEFAIFCARLSPEIRAYAYEPEPRVFTRMAWAVKANKLENRFFCFALAVAAKGGEIVIDEDKDSITGIFWPARRYTAKATTLENIFKQNKIESCDFLKMDVEGAEYDILPQAPKYIFDAIKHIALEYHGGDPWQLHRLLTGYEFDVKLFRSGNDNGYLYADKNG